MPAIFIDGKEVVVVPPKYPSTEVKEVLGGRWDPGFNGWRLAPTCLNMTTLCDFYGDEIMEGAPHVVRNLAFADWGFTGFGTETWELRERALKHRRWDDLYDFQKDAVEYMVTNPHHGGILGLSPGLGKSPTSIIAADVLGAQRILVVAPLTLAKHWIKEFDAWSDVEREWSRATHADKDPATECVVTNYETLFQTIFIDENGIEWDEPPVYDKRNCIVGWEKGPTNQKRWIVDGPTKHDAKKDKEVPARQRKVIPRQSYASVDWDLVIIDESILLKNRKAVKVNVLAEITAYSKQVWLLSGSQTAKYRDDLYPQVKMVMPRGFPSYWRFAEFFCNVDKEGWGWKITGDRPDHDPQEYLADIMFVRNQKDVLLELPDYIYDPLEIELNKDQAKAFNDLVEDWRTILEDGTEVKATIKLAQMTRLMQITSNMCNVGKKSSSAKLDLLIDLMKQNDIEYPLLVWTWYVPTADAIADRIEKEFDIPVDVLVGAMHSDDKDQVIAEFKDGTLPILVCQMGVGKFGHTFTDTRTVYYHDRHVDSDAYIQSLRRVKRIGLKHRPRLIVPRAPLSADPIIELNLAGKMESVAKVASHDLRELLRSLGASQLPWSLNDAEA